MFATYFPISFYVFFSLIAIDFFYLISIKDYFNHQIKLVQREGLTLNYFGAICTYTLMTFALVHFIIKEHKPLSDAFILGIIIYGVFEGTNYSLFKNWTYTTVLIDTLWGGILFTLTTSIIQTYFMRKI
jgi:uncharacterized membrane protein